MPDIKLLKSLKNKPMRQTVYIFMISLFSILTSWAQSPDSFSYQAVIRDGSNTIVSNQSVGMQISILQGSFNGTVVYAEVHNKTTNANGLITLIIGNGTVVSGNFSSINWNNGPYFIKTETDPTGGNNYTISGTNQMLSVPYALYAKKTEKIYFTAADAGSYALNPRWTLEKFSNKIDVVPGNQNAHLIAIEEAGIYQINCTAQISEIGNTSIYLSLNVNDQPIRHYWGTSGTSPTKAASVSWTVSLSANDVIHIGANGFWNSPPNGIRNTIAITKID